MTYPRRHLREEEEIVCERGRHPMRISRNLFTVALIFAGLGAAFALWRNAPAWFGIALGVPFVITLLYLFATVIGFRSAKLVVTTERLIYRSGVVHRSSRDIPLTSIVDISTHQSLGRRLLGFGDLSIRLGSEREPIVFNDFGHLRELATQLRAAKEHAEKVRMHSVLVGPEEPDADTEHRRLKTLHRRGVITSEELRDRVWALGVEDPSPEEEA